MDNFKPDTPQKDIGDKVTMAELIDLEGIEERIQSMKEAALELKEMGKNIPAMDRNLLRILASIKMLEINISDVLDPEV